MKSQMRELYAFFFCFPCFMVAQDRSWRRDGIKVDIAHEYLTTLGCELLHKKHPIALLQQKFLKLKLSKTLTYIAKHLLFRSTMRSLLCTSQLPKSSMQNHAYNRFKSLEDPIHRKRDV